MANIFKYEKYKVLSHQDVQKMFASFVNWRTQIKGMMNDCLQENSEEDQKAIRYAEVLIEDIQGHMHKILTDADKTDPENLLEELLKILEEPKPTNQWVRF